MAHENCLGDGDKKWKSKLTPTGGSEEKDGKIRIIEESNQLKGTHENSGNALENLSCDGTNISFDRKGTKNGQTIRVFYKKGVISGPVGGSLFINGKYKEVVIPGDADNASMDRDKSRKEAAPDPPDSDTGDWQAERPVA